MNGEDTVTVYGKPLGCIQTTLTVDALNRKGFHPRFVDITQDGEALAYAISLGHQQIPVVETLTKHWGGHRPDMIAEIDAGPGAT